jgi:hypothetical protein
MVDELVGSIFEHEERAYECSCVVEYHFDLRRHYCIAKQERSGNSWKIKCCPAISVRYGKYSGKPRKAKLATIHVPVQWTIAIRDEHKQQHNYPAETAV